MQAVHGNKPRIRLLYTAIPVSRFCAECRGLTPIALRWLGKILLGFQTLSGKAKGASRGTPHKKIYAIQKLNANRNCLVER